LILENQSVDLDEFYLVHNVGEPGPNEVFIFNSTSFCRNYEWKYIVTMRLSCDIARSIRTKKQETFPTQMERMGGIAPLPILTLSEPPTFLLSQSLMVILGTLSPEVAMETSEPCFTSLFLTLFTVMTALEGFALGPAGARSMEFVWDGRVRLAFFPHIAFPTAPSILERLFRLREPPLLPAGFSMAGSAEK